MKALLGIALTVLLLDLSACQRDSESAPHHIFDEAVRTSVLPLDSNYDSVVKFGGCTAFWVKNFLGHKMLMTSRHCTNYRITEACENGLEFFDASGRDVVARCSSVIAAQEGSDLALLKVELLPISRPYQPDALVLSEKVPNAGTRLEMIGFPGGTKYGEITRTTNCWTRTTKPVRPANDKESSRDRTIMHNCSTWGGNSGGPMLEEGTDLVVGIPASFRRDRSEFSPSLSTTIDTKELAQMYLLSTFVTQHRRTLENWGVEISQ